MIVSQTTIVEAPAGEQVVERPLEEENRHRHRDDDDDDEDQAERASSKSSGEPRPETDSPEQPAPVRAIPPVSSKRRSSWRYLLSPSYKSRSDEFHKLFADELPKGERLIADYSCALHREILIQGRLYVSINYLAFYSNIFSWITKLVVRLSDIRDIYKANTAKIIPNAIQIVTEQGDKHVFASFIARDKSYIMIWRIWRNSNLIKERLSDQEIRRLVHLSYGKDLGLNDVEEQKISGQPMARASPTSSQEAISPDANNNNNNSSRPAKSGNQPEVEAHIKPAKQKPIKLRFKSRSQSQKEMLSLIEEGAGENATRALKSHKRNSSFDLGKTLATAAILPNAKPKPAATEKPEPKKKARKSKQSDRTVRHLSMRLANLSSLAYHDHDEDDDDELQESQSPPSNKDQALNVTASSASSAVIVDTPILDPATRLRADTIDEQDSTAADQQQMSAREQTNGLDELDALPERGRAGQTATAPQQAGADPSEEDNESTRQHQLEIDPAGEELPGEPAAGPDKQSTPVPEDAGAETECGCEDHEGVVMADEQFDVSVDVLFSLIFTNSKFMRAHMLRRGMTDASISKWRRGGGGPETGDRSNSSTLSSRDSHCGQRQSSLDSLRVLNQRVGKVRPEQERQLCYSMNVNHVLAKQVQVEERQNIRLARLGLVYVLKSQTINSGFPCSESFTIDLTYCLTRAGSPDRSRMLVHGLVNFIKEKQNWRLAMIKSVIEKSSLQGIQEFIADLTGGIRDYVAKTSAEAGQAAAVSASQRDDNGDDEDEAALAEEERNYLDRATPTSTGRRRNSSRGGRSLARVKSKLKERKLRTMYKYYMKAAKLDLEETTNSNNSLEQELDGQRTGARAPKQQQQQQGQRRDQSSQPADEESSSCSSIMSSPGSSICNTDDNDSMVMMLTATNEDEDEDDDDDDDDYDDDGDHQFRRGSLRTHKMRGAAFQTSSTPTRMSLPHKSQTGGLWPALGRRLAGKNLVPLTVVGLLFALVVVVFTANVLLLRRLERIESSLQFVLANCDNHTATRLIVGRPLGADQTNQS